MAPSEWARYRSGADVGVALSSKVKWWIFVVIRLFQIPVTLAAIGVSQWTIEAKLPQPTPLVWRYGMVVSCVTTVLLVYLVPATLSNRIPGAGHGGRVPPIIDMIGTVLWAGSWISLDQAEKGINCSGIHDDALCLPYITFKALGCWDFGIFLIMAMVSTGKWYTGWKNPKMDRWGQVEGGPNLQNATATFVLPQNPALGGRFATTLRQPAHHKVDDVGVGAEKEIPRSQTPESQGV